MLLKYVIEEKNLKWHFRTQEEPLGLGMATLTLSTECSKRTLEPTTILNSYLAHNWW